MKKRIFGFIIFLNILYGNESNCNIKGGPFVLANNIDDYIVEIELKNDYIKKNKSIEANIINGTGTVKYFDENNKLIRIEEYKNAVFKKEYKKIGKEFILYKLREDSKIVEGEEMVIAYCNNQIETVLFFSNDVLSFGIIFDVFGDIKYTHHDLKKF